MTGWDRYKKYEVGGDGTGLVSEDELRAVVVAEMDAAMAEIEADKARRANDLAYWFGLDLPLPKVPR